MGNYYFTAAVVGMLSSSNSFVPNVPLNSALTIPFTVTKQPSFTGGVVGVLPNATLTVQCTSDTISPPFLNITVSTQTV